MLRKGQPPTPTRTYKEWNLVMHECEDDKRIKLLNNSPGVISGLGELPRGALIRPEFLAALFGCHTETIRRAIENGHLSPPTALPGGKFWTAGFLLDHIEERLTEKRIEQQKEERRIARSPV